MTLGETRRQGHDLVVMAFALCASVGLICLIPTLGFRVIPITAFVFLLLPWLCHRPFWFLLWLMVTYPLIWPARITLPGGLPDLAYERVTAALIVAVVSLSALVSKRRLPGLGTWATLFLVCQTAALVWGLWLGGWTRPDFGNYVNFVALPLACYWLTKTLVESRNQLLWLLGAIFIVAVAIGVSGILEFATLGLGDRVVAVSQDGSELSYGTRAVGVAVNPAIFGAILGMGALTSLFAMQHATQRRIRLAATLCTILLLVGVYLSLTRSAWISVFAALFVGQFFLNDLWKKTLPLLAVCAVFLLIAWGAIAETQVVQDRIMESDHVYGRLERMAWCWDRFLERPFFGWGLGATDLLMQGAFPVGGFATSHNTYFSMMMDGGLFLLLSFLPLLGYWLGTACKVVRTNPKASRERSVAVVMAGIVIIYALSAMSLELRYFGFFNSLLWIAGATIERSAIVAQTSQENANSPQANHEQRPNHDSTRQ